MLCDAPPGTGCRLQYWCLASTRQSGKAGRRGGARSTGRYPIQIKAQGSLLRRAADKAQLPGGSWIPGQAQADAAPACQTQAASNHGLSFLSVSPEQPPFCSRQPRTGGAVSSEGTKACRGFVQYTLPSVSSTHEHQPPAETGSTQPFSATASLRPGACSRGGGGRRETAALRVFPAPFLNCVSRRPEPRATDIKLD